MRLFRSKSGRKTLYEYKTSKTYIGWMLKTATFYFKSIKILLTLRSAIVREAKKSAGTHQNDFWVFSKMADRSYPRPSPLPRWRPKLATESNFPPTGPLWMSKSLPEWSFTKSNARGLPAHSPPPPPLHPGAKHW